MKKILSLLLIATWVVFTAMADETTPSPNNTVDGKLKPLPPPNPNRPRIPSNQTIHIVFNPTTEECLFELPNGIDHVSVEVICEETGFIFYDEVLSSNPVSFIPMTTGNYIITCTTDDGETFSGTLHI